MTQGSYGRADKEDTHNSIQCNVNHEIVTYFVYLQMSVHFTICGTCSQTAHDCNKVFGFNLPLSLLVIKRETFFELCIRTRKVQYKPIIFILVKEQFSSFYYIHGSWSTNTLLRCTAYHQSEFVIRILPEKSFKNSLVENMYCELIKNKCRIEKRMSISPCLHTYQVFRERVTLWITCRN